MKLAVVLLLISTVAYADTPTDRARKFLQTQFDKIAEGREDAVKPTFAADAIVLGLDAEQTVSESNQDLSMRLVGGSPHSVFKNAAIKSLVAGGDDTVVWFTADVTVTYNNWEPEDRPRNGLKLAWRVTELIVNDNGTWKCVAGVVTEPAKTEPQTHANHDKIGAATKAGVLAPLLASPAQLTKVLSTDKSTFVLGTDKNERAVGQAAAKKLLARWTKLGMTVDGPVREVTTKTYGFAQASVQFQSKAKDKTVYYTMQALIIAVPKGDGWSVVGVHYAN
jgi:hypothetical protein